MSVAMSNCGALGWISDRRGYRYARDDPDSGLPWPAMPAAFERLGAAAAAEAGFDGFVPDACLVNRYVPGARLSLHQDRDESDFDAPIDRKRVVLGKSVSVRLDLGGARILKKKKQNTET